MEVDGEDGNEEEGIVLVAAGREIQAEAADEQPAELQAAGSTDPGLSADALSGMW